MALSTRQPIRLLAGTVVTLLAATAARAQCTTSWLPAASGADARVAALATLPDGTLVAGGDFLTIGGIAANRIARWDGVAWSPLGAGFNAPVTALLVCADGTLIAGGQFTLTGGGMVGHVARWNGTSWSPLGAGTNGLVSALLQQPNGDIVAAGMFSSAGGQPIGNIARWNGSSWSAFGNGPGAAVLRALGTLPDGSLVTGGLLAIGGALGIARWDGTSWTVFGGGMTGGGFTSVIAIASLPNGDLVAGGNFTAAGGLAANNIARWNGAQWTPLGAGLGSVVYALAVLPDGDLVAGGMFVAAGGVAAPHVARWNGTQWTPLANTLDDTVYALRVRQDGELVVGGDFLAVDGVATTRIARRTTSCPATAVPYGAGCLGPAGPTALVATGLPWLGGSCRARATGMTPDALAVGVFAFQQLALPMPLVHPLGVAGCQLLVGDDILLHFATAAAGVTTALAIPRDMALAGGVFHHQVVLVERDAAGAITALTGTNGLTLTIGTL